MQDAGPTPDVVQNNSSLESSENYPANMAPENYTHPPPAYSPQPAVSSPPNSPQIAQPLNVTVPMQPPGYSPQPYDQPPIDSLPPGYPNCPPPKYTPPIPSASLPPQSPMMYPQQQQPNVTYIHTGTTSPVIVQSVRAESYVCQIMLALFTLFFCGILIGVVALILAVLAENTKRTNRESARQLGRSSIAASIFGIIVGAVIIAVIVGIWFSDGPHTTVRSRCPSYLGYPRRCY